MSCISTSSLEIIVMNITPLKDPKMFKHVELENNVYVLSDGRYINIETGAVLLPESVKLATPLTSCEITFVID